MIWKCCQHRWVVRSKPILLGIVNVTLDSFSDGGRFDTTERAVAHAKKLIQEGADIIDIGGESTRPGAEEVDEREELRRVIPVIESLTNVGGIPVSIDTRKPGVARSALKAGAIIVNDIAASRTDPEMWKVVAQAGAGYIAMHMQGTPDTMQRAPSYKNVVAEIKSFFLSRLPLITKEGVSVENIVWDPGFGFGKSVGHNLELLAGLSELRVADRPVLVGLSRKSFLGALTGASVDQRVPAGVIASLWARSLGATLFRTHDVALTRQALNVWEESQMGTQANKV